MTSATSIRPLARLLEAADAIVWVINPVGRLAYVSASAGDWLGVEPTELLDRQAIAGADVSGDWQDQVAAALSAPPGLNERGTASLNITPPNLFSTSLFATSASAAAAKSPVPKIPTMDVRFVRLGEGDTKFTLAIAGVFDDRVIDTEWGDALQLRQKLDRWRRQNQTMQTIVLAGSSTAVKRLRHRLKVASLARTDALLIGPRGCAGETIAASLHHVSARGEPLAIVDGSLMDTELLDATLSPLIAKLDGSRDAKGTAIVRGLDRTPVEAQQRLSQLHASYDGRLRLLTTARHAGQWQPSDHELAGDDALPPKIDLDPAWQLAGSVGITSKLVDLFCGMTMRVPPLTDRVEDIPILATALIEHGRATRECSAERLNRAAIDALIVYPWPNDFRELEQTINAAARVAPGSVVGAEHLPLAVRSYRPGDPVAQAKTSIMHLDDAVKRFETKLIDAAVEATGGNRAEAARRLGISRARLLRKLDEGS